MEREEARERAAASTVTLGGRAAPKRSLKEIAEEAARLGAVRAKTQSTPPVWTTVSRGSIADPQSVAPSSLPSRSRVARGTLLGATVAVAGIVAASAFVVVRTHRAALQSEPRAAAPAAAVVEAAPPASEARPEPVALPDVVVTAEEAKPAQPVEKRAAPAQAQAPAKKEPAADLPQEPDASSVHAAVRSRSAAAKACVAGADEPSRAQIRFSSTGNVAGVTVSGWAASHGASSCVQGAFKGIKVPGFSKPSFTVGTTIRP